MHAQAWLATRLHMGIHALLSSLEVETLQRPLTLHHTLLFQDPKADVTPWENGVRVVSFQMPLKIPEFLKKAFGVESVKVAR